jgi:hypothetical protein
MLWKYKKCYQETSEDVILPPPEICIYLNNIRGIYFGDEGTDPTSTVVEYIICGDETNTIITDSIFVGMTPIEPYEELIVNQCIKSGSLYVGGVNITNESPTGVPFWSITADFGDCP